MKFLRFLDSKSFTQTLSLFAGGLFLANIYMGWGHSDGQFFSAQNQFTQATNFMQFDYEKAWKEILELEAQGLPKSALEKVEILLENARAEKEEAQFIKGLIFQGKYKSQLEEDGLVQAISRIQSEMEKADAPVKNMLQSMLAEMYSGYLDNNQWRIRERSTTADFKPEDIRTWTAKQLQEESAELYLKSLNNNDLKRINIDRYDLILSQGNNDKGIRPTLFDFLAHRALDHFMNERNYLTQPAYKFHIDDEKAFAPAMDFSTWKIETRDTASQKLKALNLFQELLSFHLEKDIEHNPALLDADLKRLKFVHQNAVLENKDDLYLSALEKLEKRYEGHPGEADILADKAQLIFQQGQGYRPSPLGAKDEDTDRKWLLKKADEICQSVMEKYPNTVGATDCRNLRRQILEPDLQFEVEEVNLPSQPFLGKIQFRNTPKVWVRIIRFNEKRKKQFEEFSSQSGGVEKAVNYLSSLPTVRAYSIDLPDDGDFHRHSTEVKFDELPLGQYAIQMADHSDFDINKGIVGHVFTHVSSLGSWTRRGDGDGVSFVVFDRKNGAPLSGVKAEFFSRNYNSILRRNELKKVGTSTSDENGFLRPSLKNDDRNFAVLLCKDKDTLFTDDYFYDNKYRNRNNPYQQTTFFLDRAIYRPGQTVYFKGIALAFDESRMPSILKNEKVTVNFRDANYQEVNRLELRTNEYGTFDGSFMAPQGGLLGRMTLQSSIGGQQHSFRVEEYKRPKFEVKFEPIAGSFRLDDKVNVTGTAKAYAGNNIDGAQVTWRVVRQTRFPWYRWGWWRPVPSESMEIANGTTTTDEKGQFKIDFTALPDRSISADKKPEFTYTVYADVTDITGETRSNQTYVRVGYVALNASVPVASEVNTDSLKKLEIVTENLNGEFEAAKGTFTISQLETPNQIFIDRYWEMPTDAKMAKGEFEKAFPNYAWGGADKPENWKVKRQVLKVNFDTKESKEVALPKDGLPVGHYVIDLKTKDKYGVDVELKKYFSVFDLDGKTLPSPTIGRHFFEAKNYEPNDVANLYFGTSQKLLHVLFEAEKDGEQIARKWLKVKDLMKESQKISESHRGSVSYRFSYASLNRSTNSGGMIYVPWSNKELTIEYGTFRDKMLPGSEEEWTLKIKGPKGEKVAAEMVAGMYDASLDAFAPNRWGLSPFPTSYSRVNYSSNNFNGKRYSQMGYSRPINLPGENQYRSYRSLNWFDWYYYNQDMNFYTMAFESETYDEVVIMRDSAPRKKRESRNMAKTAPMAADGVALGNAAVPEAEMAMDESLESGEMAPPPPAEGGNTSDLSEVPVRTNLDETVFFFPKMMTDDEGNVVLKFKMNEALTKWKFLGLAHTQDLKIGSTTKEVVTQKELMVVPNPPRFFRENDEIEFTAKVVNLSEQPLVGNAQLQLVNPMNALPVFKWKDNPDFNSSFYVDPGQSARLAWRFKVPEVTDVSMIEHTVVAAAGDFSDAERNVAPVLSNRMLVTETMPLPVRGGESKTFTFTRMKEAKTSTLKHESLTLEFTQNPAWYAVQALPYLMEYPHECTEQIFSRFYANSLATSVANSHPKVKTIFDRWRNYEPEALMSNLSKNQELKSVLLEETPWVLNAQSEEQQKKNIALLFDLNRMSHEQASALRKLQERQQAGGGWAWFPGGRDNWYITQYIVEGLGHLQKLGVRDIESDPAVWAMVEKAVHYCDERMVDMYNNLEREVKKGNTTWEADHLNYLASHYLYTRSFFLENKSGQASTSGNFAAGKKIELRGKAEKVHAYYLSQAKSHWLDKGMYVEGMLALGLHRDGEIETAKAIVRSLDERSLNHDDLGMYWKYPRGWWWYQAPIETHALMIEAYSDIGNDSKKVDDLKVWLLKNKQTNHWKTTKATASAVYALLSSGDNWLMDDTPLNISFPAASNSDLEKQIADAQSNAEAGTGYFKTRFDGSEITGGHSVIQVENPNNVVAWGAMYWQYFEQLDKITTFEETPLTINKKLFRVKNSDTGEVIHPVNEGDDLTVGEKLKVRIEIRTDRDMEYVHLKDMRASGFEPINVLSQYKWQEGLGYYESTRDVATDFFISFLPKGTYVFEYPLRVVHNGNFSNGLTTAQCMYAPEFSSHSEGVRVVVD